MASPGPTKSYKQAVREFQRKLLWRALADANGNACQAAADLGIHRNTFQRLCQQTARMYPGEMSRELLRGGLITLKQPRAQKPQPRLATKEGIENERVD